MFNYAIEKFMVSFRLYFWMTAGGCGYEIHSGGMADDFINFIAGEVNIERSLFLEKIKRSLKVEITNNGKNN